MRSIFTVIIFLGLGINSGSVVFGATIQQKMSWKAQKQLKNGNLERVPYRHKSSDVYRDLPVSDQEIREIVKGYNQEYSKDMNPDLIGIGPVIEGCSCESEECTNQVTFSYQNRYIQFSKVSGHWQVSSLYKWWFKYGQLFKELSKPVTLEREVEIQNEINILFQFMPHC